MYTMQTLQNMHNIQNMQKYGKSQNIVTFNLSVSQLFLIVETMIPCQEVTFLDEAQRKWHNGAIVLMEEVKVVRVLNDGIAMELVDNKKVDVVDITFGIIWAKTFRSEVYPNYLFFRAFFEDVFSILYRAVL